LEHDEAVLQSDDHSGLEVVFVPVESAKAGKNRLHLDLVAGSAEERARLVEVLLGHGARHADIGQGEVPLVVMAGPEDNEFCVAIQSGAAGRLGAICLDAAHPEAQGRFWSAATGWNVEVIADGGVALRAPGGKGPALTLGPPVAPKAGKSRAHLDIAPYPGDDQADVDRLVSLGARLVDIGQSEVSWVVLADPEDNEFCVLTPC
jgi:hypothetical protein